MYCCIVKLLVAFAIMSSRIRQGEKAISNFKLKECPFLHLSSKKRSNT